MLFWYFISRGDLYTNLALILQILSLLEIKLLLLLFSFTLKISKRFYKIYHAFFWYRKMLWSIANRSIRYQIREHTV